ncbi:MAG: hypothetical protein JRH15_03600 [Deltaproteobacteria bacterium]|nr:hypothetical protein [Deltaproteobacteria bacterium]
MKIKIGHSEWKEVILFEPPPRTVILSDGSIWHLARSDDEILELDLYLTHVIEKYAPWEVQDKKTLALTKDKRTFSSYRIELEKDDELKYEMFYFYKFTYDKENYLKFPEYLIEGKCVEVVSTALRYFLADTLFFDFLISKSSSEKSVAEVFSNMSAMKNQWVLARLKHENEK